jgi:hypothetical protein
MIRTPSEDIHLSHQFLVKHNLPNFLSSGIQQPGQRFCKFDAIFSNKANEPPLPLACDSA